jgi:hypothetical protein
MKRMAFAECNEPLLQIANPERLKGDKLPHTSS